ncbi:MAG: alpha/beta hydrolase [Lachnospiraceae bacterium]|nr:alpha/beta hydrolase [Lachnospiraceae bacterium]
MKKSSRKLLKLAAFLSTAAGLMYMINRTIENSALLKDKLHTEEDTFFEWKLGNIFYTKQGSGSPLLLIHDLTPYGSSYEWKSTVEAFAHTHTVYTIDLLGCGRSDKPNITYTNFVYVQLINDFIKNIIKEKTDIISIGLSTSLTVMSAAYTPDNFGKLIFINPTDLGQLQQSPNHETKIIKKLLELPLLGTCLYNTITGKGNLDLKFTEEYFYNPFHINRDLEDAYYEASHKGRGNNRYLLASLDGRYINMNIIPSLSNLSNPIYILGGKAQSNIKDILNSYQKYAPTAKTIIISQSKYLPHVENTEETLIELNKIL